MKIIAILITIGLTRARVLEDIVKPFNFGPVGSNVKITGGEEAVPHSIPYQAGLFIETTGNDTYFCGGTLISPSVVLTVGHCIYKAVKILVVLGAHNIQEKELHQKRFITTKFKHHENYTETGITDDIGVVYLPELVEYSDYIAPIDLPTWSDANNDFVGQNSLQSGWGKTSDLSSGITDKLQFIKTKVITNEKCDGRYLGLIEDCHICTETTNKKSTCHGDSGGPLVSEDRKLIGATSFVIVFGCEFGWPAGFTRITSYLGWIEDNSDIIIRD